VITLQLYYHFDEFWCYFDRKTIDWLIFDKIIPLLSKFYSERNSLVRMEIVRTVFLFIKVLNEE